jgi:hypothetical protein
VASQGEVKRAVGEIAFRLRLVEAAQEWVVVCTTDVGEAVRKIPTPFSPAELDRTLLEIEKAFLLASSPLVTRHAATDGVPRQVGRRLSEAVLGGDVRSLFDRCRARARERREPIQLHVDTEGPNVSRIPWELLTDPDVPDDYLALRYPVIRTPHLLDSPPPPQRLVPPMRVLGVVSTPHDLPSLDVEAEHLEVSRALGKLNSDLVYVEWLASDRWADLANAVRFRPWHVLHFIGHGGFDRETGSGYIELADDDGRAMHVSGTDLGHLVAANPELRLVVLNACEQAVAGTQGVFSSTAAKLMREGVPAVVAMQYEISDDAAVVFSSQFYEALARGLPVDGCVTLARETVKVTLGSLEWATPVLFLASDQRQLFLAPDRQAVSEPSPAETDEATHSSRIPPAVPVPSPAPWPVRAGQPPPAMQPAAARPPATQATWIDLTRERLSRYVRSAVGGGGSPPPTGLLAAPAAFPAARGPIQGHAPVAAPLAPGSPSHLASAVPPLAHVRRPAVLGPAVRGLVGPRESGAGAGAGGGAPGLGTTRQQLIGQCALPRRQRPELLAWSPWLRHLATAHDDGTVAVWDVQTEVPARLVACPGRVEALAFATNGRWLALACKRAVRVLDERGQVIRELRLTPIPELTEVPGSWAVVHAVAFAPADRALLVAGDDGTVRQYDVQGQLTGVLRHPAPVLAVTAGDTGVVTACADGRVSVWSWRNELQHRWQAPAWGEHMALSPDGTVVCLSGSDGVLRIWRCDGTPVAGSALTGRPVGLGILPLARVLTVTDDGALDIWHFDPAVEELP